MKIKFKFLSLTILLFACGEAPDLSNSILDTSLGETTPETDILIESQTYGQNIVFISWEGDQYVNAFRYKLIHLNQTDMVTTYSDWSEWDKATTNVTFEYLDEGQYEFHVEGRFNLDHVGSDVLPFEVDAIQGETLRMFPLRQFVEIDSMFNVYLFSEEIDQLSGMQVKLNFDPDVFEYQSSTDHLGTDIVNYYETNNPLDTPVGDFHFFEFADGSITFTVALFGDGLDGIDTSLELLKLRFKYLGNVNQGSTEITIDLSECTLGDGGPVLESCIETKLYAPLIQSEEEGSDDIPAQIIDIIGGSHMSSLIKEVQ